jgi:membrane-associated phospholipid phosphatase
VKPSERLTLAALLSLAALTLVTHPPGASLHIAVFAALAALTAWLVRCDDRSALTSTGSLSQVDRRRLRFVRDWLPVVIVIVVYLLLQPVIEAVNPRRLDAQLAAFDQAHFTALVHHWRDAFGRPDALTDAVYLAYFSYYLLPAVVAAAAWRQGAVTYERTVLPLLLAFYITYLGYIVLPAAGPRVPVEAQAIVLGGGWASETVRAFLRAAESTTLDAFPSGHTAISLVAAALAWHVTRPRSAAIITLWACAIVFATVYIQVHYVADVLAGCVVAVAVLAVARAFARHPQRSAT